MPVYIMRYAPQYRAVTSAYRIDPIEKEPFGRVITPETNQHILRTIPIEIARRFGLYESARGYYRWFGTICKIIPGVNTPAGVARGVAQKTRSWLT